MGSLFLFTFIPFFFIIEHPNMLIIPMLVNTMGVAASWYQAPGYFKLTSINRRYGHGKVSIILLLITWILVVASTLIYYMAITWFAPKNVFWPMNPELADMATAMAISSLIIAFPATLLLAITI